MLLYIDISSYINHQIHTIGMFSIIIFLLLSSVNAQYYYQQRQYPYNNYNQWSSYPLGNQGTQQSKLVDSLFIQ